MPCGRGYFNCWPRHGVAWFHDGDQRVLPALEPDAAILSRKRRLPWRRPQRYGLLDKYDWEMRIARAVSGEICTGIVFDKLMLWVALCSEYERKDGFHVEILGQPREGEFTQDLPQWTGNLNNYDFVLLKLKNKYTAWSSFWLSS